MKISERFFKNRVKPIVIAQFILLVPIIILVVLSFRTYPVNFYYSGFTQILFTVSMFLLGVEQYLLKKKGYAFACFAVALLGIFVAVQSFYVAGLKR